LESDVTVQGFQTQSFRVKVSKTLRQRVFIYGVDQLAERISQWSWLYFRIHVSKWIHPNEDRLMDDGYAFQNDHDQAKEDDA
jgi:hypothetical protein